ncbi:MAG TPA: S1/P1 nuclease [Rhizomicrobium sp.]
MPRIALILLLAFVPVPAWAWGAEGHEIAAAVALAELTPTARAQVAALLGSDAMLIHDSNWADEIRDRRPETGGWHFVDVPLDAPGYDARRDCGGGDCVVGQIARDLRTLGDHGQSRAARAEALRFLVHFVADIHQPLHTVDNHDKGGNEIRVSVGHYRTNMHHLWDTSLVEAVGGDAAAIASEIDHGLTSAQKKAWSGGTASAWADESHAIARDDIYAFTGDRRTVRLPRDYPDAEADVVKLQLAKAGVRLAWLLNGALR